MSIDHLFKNTGALVSSCLLSDQTRQDAEVFYHHREKSECALVAMSSWYGGDVFEFGAHDLNTFRNMLTAIHLSGMAKVYTDTQFWAFDAFGKFSEIPNIQTEWGCDLKEYFKPYSNQGDKLELHKQYIVQHNLFVDRCHLVQGLFNDTCTPEFKSSYGNRKIGYVSIDCNVAWSYKTVFEFIFDMMSENSYIYMDEGLQNPEVLSQWKQFRYALREKRNIGTVYIRNAGGFGSLWRLYPIIHSYPLSL